MIGRSAAHASSLGFGYILINLQQVAQHLAIYLRIFRNTAAQEESRLAMRQHRNEDAQLFNDGFAEMPRRLQVNGRRLITRIRKWLGAPRAWPIERLDNLVAPVWTCVLEL